MDPVLENLGLNSTMVRLKLNEEVSFNILAFVSIPLWFD